MALIKREDATETFAELYDIFDDCPNIVKELHKVYDKILAIPSAEEKQGEWIYCENNGQDGYRCSECGLFVPWCYEYHDSNFILDYQVCPYCLTRMKGADDED